MRWLFSDAPMWLFVIFAVAVGLTPAMILKAGIVAWHFMA